MTKSSLVRGENILIVLAEVVACLDYVEKNLCQEIKYLTKHHTNSPPIKIARVFLNRQRDNEKNPGSHMNEGTVISASLHICTDDIMGGGLHILGGVGRTFCWSKGKATSLLFCECDLTP